MHTYGTTFLEHNESEIQSTIKSQTTMMILVIVIVVVVIVVTSTRPSNAFHNKHNQHRHPHPHRRFSNNNGGDDTICWWSQYNRRPLQHQHHPLRQSIVNKLRGGDNNNNNINKYNNKQSRQEETIIKTRGRGRGGTTISTSALMMTSTNSICGGGSGENGNDEEVSIEEKEMASASKKKERYRRNGMTIALMLGNFSVMGAKCALPSVLSLLLSTDRGLTFVVPNKQISSATIAASQTVATVAASIPQQQFAKLLGFSTFSIALGKLLLGPIIDTLGGIRALQVTLLLLTVMLATITMTQQFVIFAVCWVCVDFVFSSCWASCISSIQQSFPAQEWGTQIGHLATGARLGNAVSFSLFAAILFALEDTMVQPWRVVFLVSTVLQIIPFGLLVYFGGMTIQKNQQAMKSTSTTASGTTTTSSFTSAAVGSSGPTLRDSLRVLQTEARTSPEFWLHLTSRSCLMVFASFLLFVPTLMNQVYGCSNAVAAQVASAYSLGCLLSVSLGSKLFAKVLHSTPPTVTSTATASQSVTTTQSKSSSRKSIIAIVGLLSLATSSSLLQLGHATGRITLSWTLSTISMFVWGFAFSLPFYLPSSLYALARGGRECSASIADCFDFVGFALLAFFNRYVASLEQHSNPASWIGCFQLTTACSVIAMITQSLAVYLEHQKRRRRTMNK